MPDHTDDRVGSMAPDTSGVVLGVAGTRREWLSRLSRWSMSASARVEFLRCLTSTEAGAVLGAGRRVTLVLIDAASADRDLIALARSHDTPCVLVRDPAHPADWVDLGCASQIDDDVTGEELVDLLHRLDDRRRPGPDRAGTSVDLAGPPTPGRLVTVLGTGGSGSTTVAMLLAHGLGAGGSTPTDGTDQVVLVDATSTAALALYHDLGDVVPGVPELLELHRGDLADPAEIRDLAFVVGSRNYSFVLGAPRQSTSIRSGSATTDSALSGLRRTFPTVIIDAGGAGGADRSPGLAQSALRAADAIVAVGRPGLHGTHALARRLAELGDERPSTPVLVVCNTARRGVLERRAFRGALPRRATPGAAPLAVTDLARIRGLEELHRSVAALPQRPALALAQRLLDVIERPSRQAAA